MGGDLHCHTKLSDGSLGIEDLITAVIRTSEQKRKPRVKDFCEKGAVHRCIHAVSHQVEDHAQSAGLKRLRLPTTIVLQALCAVKSSATASAYR